ncbi:MAG: DUF11 domain-containing protein, partial [Chloroflexi bacterium]|nr:DUF11 domain-containing protein [Chloroflexota bacterium]
GDVTLVDVDVTDSLLGSLLTDATLAPGANVVITVVYTVLPGDLDPLVNTATVTSGVEGLPNRLGPVEASATVNLFQPGIDITKTADTKLSKAGDVITYTITVTNTSSVDSPDLVGTVDDSLLGPGVMAFTLPAGASASISLAYVVQPGDPDPLVNIATVTASPEGFPNVLQASASWEVDLVHPAIDITKRADTEISKAGDNITYEIVVTNTGDVTLVDVDVTDSLTGAVLTDGTLLPGESQTFTIIYTVQPGDPDPLVNTATVTSGVEGLPNRLGPIETSVTVDLVHPAITITKDCDPSSGRVGDNITYTITITNTGDVALENITVTDSLMGDLSASFVDTLAPGASDTQQFLRAILFTDPDPLVNTAIVTAKVVGLPNIIEARDDCSVDILREGLTPGFWKNNASKKNSSQWVFTAYTPDQKINTVFTGTLSEPYTQLGNKTLLQGLSFQGGENLKGAAEILLRAAIAAVLNATHPEIDYPLTDAQVKDMVNAALASQDRATILALASLLDSFNNLGADLSQNP